MGCVCAGEPHLGAIHRHKGQGSIGIRHIGKGTGGIQPDGIDILILILYHRGDHDAHSGNTLHGIDGEHFFRLIHGSLNSQTIGMSTAISLGINGICIGTDFVYIVVSRHQSRVRILRHLGRFAGDRGITGIVRQQGVFRNDRTGGIDAVRRGIGIGRIQFHIGGELQIHLHRQAAQRGGIGIADFTAVDIHPDSQRGYLILGHGKDSGGILLFHGNQCAIVFHTVGDPQSAQGIRLGNGIDLAGQRIGKHNIHRRCDGRVVQLDKAALAFILGDVIRCQTLHRFRLQHQMGTHRVGAEQQVQCKAIAVHTAVNVDQLGNIRVSGAELHGTCDADTVVHFTQYRIQEIASVQQTGIHFNPGHGDGACHSTVILRMIHTAQANILQLTAVQIEGIDTAVKAILRNVHRNSIDCGAGSVQHGRPHIQRLQAIALPGNIHQVAPEHIVMNRVTVGQDKLFLLRVEHIVLLQDLQVLPCGQGNFQTAVGAHC